MIMEMEIEDGFPMPDEVSALPMDSDDDSDYDVDYTPKGHAIKADVYEVEVD
jgi:hypothetical protein